MEQFVTELLVVLLWFVKAMAWLVIIVTAVAIFPIVGQQLSLEPNISMKAPHFCYVFFGDIAIFVLTLAFIRTMGWY